MGVRNFGFDSLKSRLNGDMEEKAISPRLSCRTAADLPPPELPDCHQSSPDGAAGLTPELQWQSGSSGLGSFSGSLPDSLPGSDMANLQIIIIYFCMESPCISHSYSYPNHVRIYFKVCMCLGEPEIQHNTPNPRKSVVFIICPL